MSTPGCGDDVPDTYVDGAFPLLGQIAERTGAVAARLYALDALQLSAALLELGDAARDVARLHSDLRFAAVVLNGAHARAVERDLGPGGPGPLEELVQQRMHDLVMELGDVCDQLVRAGQRLRSP